MSSPFGHPSPPTQPFDSESSSSPSLVRPYSTTTSSARPITPSPLGSSADSDMSNASETIRPSFLRANNPLTPNHGALKPYPHPGDLLGTPSEASGSSSRRESPSYPNLELVPERPLTPDNAPVSHHDQADGPPRFRDWRRGERETFTSTQSDTSIPRYSNIAPFTQRRAPLPSHILPRIDPDPPHLQAFDRRNDIYNELGTTDWDSAARSWRRRHEGDAIQFDRQSLGQEENGDTFFPRPDLHRPSRPTARPMSISPPARASQPDSPVDPGLGSLMFAYGLMGNIQSDLTSRRPIPNLAPSSTTVAPDSPIPSVPAPRRSRTSSGDSDQIDFSPQRTPLQSHRRDFRPQIRWAEPRTSLEVSDNLRRLDALRAAETYFPFDPYPQAYNSQGSSWRLDYRMAGNPSSQAANVSSRLGRYPLDEPRDLRSRVRRNESEEARASDNEADAGGSAIHRLHRNVQDAVGRRVAGDQSHSPTSAARRHREISAPYPRPARPFIRRDDSDDAIQFYPQPGYPWGQVPIDTVGTEPQDPLRFPSMFTLPGPNAQLDSTARRARIAHAFNAMNARYPFDDETLETDTSELRQVFGAGADIIMDPADYPPRVSVFPNPMSHLEIKHEMAQADKLRIAKMVVRAVQRSTGSCRRAAAASMVENVAWEDLEETPEMEKDVYCSVCHDEYEAASKIAVTPCKHMYHKDCLNIWLDTPNTSSCPMCRRDLAVLSFIIGRCTGKTKEEGLPIWMAL